jgi:hypothetical protein
MQVIYGANFSEVEYVKPGPSQQSRDSCRIGQFEKSEARNLWHFGAVVSQSARGLQLKLLGAA